MAFIGDTIPDQFRGKAIGAVTSSFAVASVLGLPIGLYLAERFSSYGVPFLVIAGVSVGVWVVTWFRLPSVNRHLVHRTGSSIAAFGAVLRQPNHLWSFAFMFTLVLGTFTIIPFLAAHLQINCGRSRMDIPWIYAIAGACTLFGMNLVGWLTDKYGKRPIFLTAAICTIAMTVVITHLTTASFATASIAASLFMVLASGRIVPAQGMMLAAADPKMRGAFTTMNSAASHLATSVGPIVAGLVMRTEKAVNESGLEEIVRLERYDQAGWIAVGFAVIAVGLSFALRPFKPRSTTGSIVQPVPTSNPVSTESPALAT
jgi:predicted MFS family arabinose efflux permease